MIIPYTTKLFNVIDKPYISGKVNSKVLVFKVCIKSSKSEIKNVFQQIYPFRVIKVRTVIIKQKQMWKKAYITYK